MGETYSKTMDHLPPLKDDMFIIYCLRLGTNEYIILINSPEDVVNIVLKNISSEYSSEYKIESINCLIKQISVKAKLFLKSTTKAALLVRQLFCKINDDLTDLGCTLVSSPHLVHQRGLSSWIYSKLPDNQIIGEHCAIGLSGYSSLLFVNFSPDMVNEFVSHICHVYNQPTTDEESAHQKTNLVNDATASSKIGELKEKLPRQYKYKFNERLWTSSGATSLTAKRIVHEAIIFMHSRGYKLQATALFMENGLDTLLFARLSAPTQMIANSQILLALKATDYIVVLGASDDIVNRLKTFFYNHWPHGLKDLPTKHAFPVIKFNESPWSNKSIKELNVKQMLVQVFEDLSEIGYEPVCSITCSARISRKSAILLNKSEPCRMRFICLSVSMYLNKFSIINATDEEREIIRKEMTNYYIPGIKKEAERGCSWKMTLQLYPISGFNGMQSACYQTAILSILQQLASVGYKLAICCDVSEHTADDGSDSTVAADAQSLFLCKALSSSC